MVRTPKWLLATHECSAAACVASTVATKSERAAWPGERRAVTPATLARETRQGGGSATAHAPLCGRCGPLSVGGRAVGAALCGHPGAARLAGSLKAAPQRRLEHRRPQDEREVLVEDGLGKGPRRVREGSRKREVLVEDGLRHRLARRLRGRFRDGSREEGIALTLPLPLPLPLTSRALSEEGREAAAATMPTRSNSYAVLYLWCEYRR